MDTTQIVVQLTNNAESSMVDVHPMIIAVAIWFARRAHQPAMVSIQPRENIAAIFLVQIITK